MSELYRKVTLSDENGVFGEVGVRSEQDEHAVAAWEKVKAAYLRKFGPDKIQCLHPGSSVELLEGYCSECAEEFCDEIGEMMLDEEDSHD